MKKKIKARKANKRENEIKRIRQIRKRWNKIRKRRTEDEEEDLARQAGGHPHSPGHVGAMTRHWMGPRQDRTAYPGWCLHRARVLTRSERCVTPRSLAADTYACSKGSYKC
ncbi:hypothetical protein E2C01_083167 [Portunus trituberculatus]|uniref:Uncharacterized protein n=1 Tax=Portunus trituberculatus TaxID=210409 RepID=A0A5B7J3S6_PORTR|nr:hypothetical protein [Portunus trituberculatus]